MLAYGRFVKFTKWSVKLRIFSKTLNVLDICQGHWYFLNLFILLGFGLHDQIGIRFVLGVSAKSLFASFFAMYSERMQFFSVFKKKTVFKKHLSFDLSSRRLWCIDVMIFSEVTLSSYLLLIKTFSITLGNINSTLSLLSHTFAWIFSSCTSSYSLARS